MYMTSTMDAIPLCKNNEPPSPLSVDYRDTFSSPKGKSANNESQSTAPHFSHSLRPGNKKARNSNSSTQITIDR